MKERQIIFSAPMVSAILEGRKTQTRRVAKPVKHPDLGNIYTPGALVLEHEPRHVIERACPYGQPGDRLWVREAFRLCAEADSIPPRETDAAYRVWYEAAAPHQPGFGKLRPGMFMPRWASRITLEITGVRVERLQDISPDDCIAEGAWSIANRELGRGEEAITAYRKLWESIHGQGSFDPRWVWVIEFKAVTP